MKQIAIKAPGGLDNLILSDAPDAAAPNPGEITVRLHANSLNFHDYMVAKRENGAADGRIPMADGAGVVTATGDGVTEFSVGIKSYRASSPTGRTATTALPISPVSPATASTATLAKR